MKKLTLFSMACLVAGLANAQKLKPAEVPTAVSSSFGKLFPKAREIKWSRESAEEYEAEFKSDGKEMSAGFNPSGVWQGTETEIKNSDLPKAIQETIARDFAGFALKESEQAETPGKALAYEVELEKGKATYEVQFSASGKVIKQEEKKEGSEKKD